SGSGTLFKLNTDGTGFANVYHFTGGGDGSHPHGGLIFSSNTLYGTTRSGTAFAVNTNGLGFTTLHVFNGCDGAQPLADLVLSGNTLYGTTTFGGCANDSGTVFAVS